MSERSPYDLTGRRAVITGASQGIGAAAAIALAAAGADVAFTYRSADAEAEQTASAIRGVGQRTIVLKGDTGDPMHVRELADRVVAEWGGIDIWVNNAAALQVKPFLELTDQDWHGLLAANLHGYYYGCRAAIGQMVAQGGGGRVINVTSVVDIQPIAELSAYVTAKGGILGLTKTLAVEFGPHQITVNALSPGATDTPLNQVAYTPQVRKTYNERIPLGRIASAEEIADPFVFLASDASRYVTGMELVVDGGIVLNGNVGTPERTRNEARRASAVSGKGAGGARSRTPEQRRGAGPWGDEPAVLDVPSSGSDGREAALRSRRRRAGNHRRAARSSRGAEANTFVAQ